MKALVLSAGYGERLRPLTDVTPKPLLEVGGRPLIHYPLLMLKHAGVTDVTINVHYLGGQIETALGSGSTLGIAIAYSPETALLGTGGSLLPLRDHFAGEPFVLLNCDTIMNFDLRRMIEFHRERGGLATFALRGGNDYYSRIEIADDRRIHRMRLLRARAAHQFDDHPAALAPEVAAILTPYMYCGAMVCGPSVLQMLPKVAPFGLVGEVFAPMIARGLPLFGFVDDGFFRTVDDLESYEALRKEFVTSPPMLAYLTD